MNIFQKFLAVFSKFEEVVLFSFLRLFWKNWVNSVQVFFVKTSQNLIFQFWMWISCVLENWINNLYPKIEELLNQSFLHSIPVAPNIDSTQCTSVGSPVYSKLSVWADSRAPAQQSVWKIIRRLFWSSLPPFKFPDNGWCWWAYQWFRKGSY